MITGASGGLGRALAAALAPTHTLFLAGRPSARLDAVADEFGATTWPMELAEPDELETVVEPIVELDVLVHNAGVAYPARVAESSVDEWRATLGHVVFINSGAGINASPGLASYTASKFALRGFADSLRADEPALRVTSIHPGRIATPMQEDLVAYEGREYQPEHYLSPETVARVTADAINAPADAHVHEVIVRPR